jgi:hypothetical protein
MQPFLLTIAVAATQAGVIVHDGGVAAPGPAPQLIETGSEARSLCDALTPMSRLVVEGTAVERARAEAEHDALREEALRGTYRVAIPARRLIFAPYDPGEGTLALSARAYLTAAGDVLHVWPVDDPTLPVAVGASDADRILAAASQGTLVLTIAFTVPGDAEEVACVHPNGAKVHGLGIAPFAWEYADGDRVLARGGEGADRPVVSAAEGARPIVEIAAASGVGGEGLRDSVAAHDRDLEACYQRALQRDPTLDGTVVADFDLGAAGAPRAVRMAVDSVQDDGLVTCVRDVLARVKLPAGHRDRVLLPIRFVLERPTADAR